MVIDNRPDFMPFPRLVDRSPARHGLKPRTYLPFAVALAPSRSRRGFRPVARKRAPLFVNFDRAGKSGRLTGSAVYFIVRGLGTTAGFTVRPHGLRHLAITSAS
jgi:hypothetical protein